MTTQLVPGVTADPKIAFGKPVIAGTRTPVAVLLAQLGAGVPDSVLREEYDLTEEQVLAAIRYGAWLAEHEVIRATAE
jgi:uncharacterized protein (DUF433 family)